MHTELVRTRDVVFLLKGDTFPVSLSPTLAAQEWSGGQGVAWESEFVVGRSDGNPSGFLILGSDEPSDWYTSLSRSQSTYKRAVMGLGGWVCGFRVFETTTWASRQVNGNTPIAYAKNQTLYYSLRGLLTSEDEWTLSGDPRGPNPFPVGFVVRVPSASTEHYLTAELRL